MSEETRAKKKPKDQPGIIVTLRKANAEADRLRTSLEEIIRLQQTAKGDLNTMAASVDALKAQIAEIKADVVELDGDVQEVIDKLNGFGDAPTAAEMDELKSMLTDLKSSTRSAADKVAEPTPPTP